MTSILIIDKNGTVSESIIKKYDETMLFKKAGLKTCIDFCLQHTFKISCKNVNYSVSVYGKTIGKSNIVNKYDFPPPIDNILFYGSCVLVGNIESTKEVCNLKLSEWNSIYSMLFGGFEDIDVSESNEDSDVESVDERLLTKDGYLKDDFVVDDSEVETIDSVDSLSEISIDENVLKCSKKGKKCLKKKEKIVVNARKVSKKMPNKVEQPQMDSTYLGCASELVADEYFR